MKANRSQFSQWDTGADLRQQVAAKGTDIQRNIVSFDTPAVCTDCPKEVPENNSRVRWAARQSDLVAIGTITGKTSSFTLNNAFIFADSQFKIDEILKGDVSPGVLDDGGNSREITVTTPGGAVKVNGHVVSASISNRESLAIGHTYVLFLKYIPASHSYIPENGIIGFDVTENIVHCLYTGTKPPAEELISNKSEYIAALRSSIE